MKNKKTSKIILGFLIFLLGIGTLPSAVKAIPDPLEEIDAKIQRDKSALNAKKSEVAGLSSQVSFLNQQIVASDANINALSRDISVKEAQIKDTETKIVVNKKNLKQLIQLLYEQEKISSFELFASAASITDVMDAEEYNRAMEDKVNATLLENKALKSSLETERLDLANKKANLEAQKQAQLAQKLAQASLLNSAYNEQLALEKMVNMSQQQKNAILAARRAQSRRAPGGSSAGCGGYPSVWCNAAQDSMVDSYGFYNRECTSYAAWKWNSLGYNWFNTQPGRGSAKYWPEIARTLGYRTGSTPQKGALMIWTGWTYGHVAYVESVNGDGTVNVSHYNWDLDGRYSEDILSASGHIYIYPN